MWIFIYNWPKKKKHLRVTGHLHMCRSDREDRVSGLPPTRQLHCNKCTWQQGQVHCRVVRSRCSMYGWKNKGKITTPPLACMRFTVRAASWHLPGRRGHTYPRSNGDSMNQYWAQKLCVWGDSTCSTTYVPHLWVFGYRCAGCRSGEIPLGSGTRNCPSCWRKSADIHRCLPSTRPHLSEKRDRK